jgi:hypothetical protein
MQLHLGPRAALWALVDEVKRDAHAREVLREEYEMLVEAKYPASDPEVIGQGRVRMGPQLVAHLLMIALIVLGNIAMIAGRPRGGAR